jgi:hypothetical protein
MSEDNKMREDLVLHVEQLKVMVGEALRIIDNYVMPEVYDEYVDFCIKLECGDFDEILKGKPVNIRTKLEDK